MAKQIWLYSCVDAGMSLSCWIWNRTLMGQVGMRPPYGANCLVTIGGVSCGLVTVSNSSSSDWVYLACFVVPLRCWQMELQINANDLESLLILKRAYIVLIRFLVGGASLPRVVESWRCLCLSVRLLVPSGP